MISAAARAESFLVADSPAMRAAVAQLRAFADGGAPVVICGEHGTGRELIARVLHDAGPRRAAPFVAVRPSFEGPDVARWDGAGDARALRALAAAFGGTLLVKDLSDVSAASQCTLRTAIANPASDVQVVATADLDLDRAVDARIVSRELYDRFAARCIVVPPLRDRRADLPALFERWVAHYAAEIGRTRPAVTPRAHARLARYPWVGCATAVVTPVGLNPDETRDLPSGRGPDAVGTAVPQVSCGGAPDVGPADGFHHISSDIIAALGDPQHRGLDLIATADQDPQSIEGWLAYTVADKSLEGEDVDLYACVDNAWQYLGTATTDDNGHYALPLTGDARLPLGMRDLYASVVGDRTSTQYIAYVAADDQPLIVSDVDGTLTTSEYQFIETIALGIDCTVWPGAADAYNDATSEGYQLVYLTSRGNQYTTETRQWLAEQGFPPGPIRLSPNFITLPGNDTVDFKTSAMQGFMTGFALTAGIGNRLSDMEAYTNVGLPPADIWVKMPECQADLDAGDAFSFTDYPTLQSTFIDTLP